MSAATPGAMTRRHGVFLFALLVAIGLSVPPLALLGDVLTSDTYSHILLIPLVSAYFLYHGRTAVFADVNYCPRWGCPISAASLVLYLLGAWSLERSSVETSTVLTVASLSFVGGAFIWAYGGHAFTKAAFPFLFLLFMVPLPGRVMDGIIYFLQAGSAEVTNLIFAGVGIPHFREGFVFQVPGFSIEIAKQCSGIRSSLALAITAVLAAHLFLDTWWQRAVVIMSILPLVLIKNGIRISVLTLLAMHVDPVILVDGFLHRSGGVFFFLPVLGLMGAVIGVLRAVSDGSPRPSLLAAVDRKGSARA
jgi:exosortase